MDLGLKGKRALVTGSTAGIGLAVARLLSAEGASATTLAALSMTMAATARVEFFACLDIGW